MFYYIQIFTITLLLSAALTWLVMKLAMKLGIMDKPDAYRKIHILETPLLGGLAIFATFFIILYLVRYQLLSGNLEPRHWLGFFAGGAWLMIGGFLDDKYNLKPIQQIIWPFLAIASVIIGGVEIEKITNPFGGFIYLGAFSTILIALWLFGIMYTTKLLDGLDGLVSGMTAIGALVIFLFTMSEKYYQSDIGLAALILAAACLGFLFFNWHPAKIFLGEGGSLFLGYALGVLAIISGGKIAIALLVMGLPILDVAWTILRRLVAWKNPFKFADKKHLHFRLLNMGLSVKKSVLFFYIISIIFGLAALFLQSKGKVLALTALLVIMILVVMFFACIDRKNKVV
ncbi:undecaprenyl/decaprenyl-phosphate alpha-N-acetylglucosaminyl 1-phosphate transferase [Patescibacteria group bacterium]|nr:undecaprenyl/decaprenyl-phosphate alpha-N-acetylglucosaminyl 1-phosphate transferase [Patescibacteria group bacterium]MBU2007826.1 undecaprenyl/decaprenyl-phosphate alpha-N-acetylglucosaminyl 1-phosphate transferase [Patescibacteria group bacterium]MBU2233259.1 undecaprenyl/decaprenyl-phosphate alpha-N-acetylglucosaminyl 1-phosphate transferase [Patescibacteria group bacterium]MBU2264416.1 undecaprenyl/decaprenyl-phosphate alpha-N-acetylglucosaminyl 1-phosphate transferase [Patescibacteria gr